mmetsp:Transcript_24205/g.53718  ORF Transcript_24205/g.53718 Transcript_24205/m.53718 type:complete len:1622 (-) Transcript_24205:204-5069(-)
MLSGSYTDIENDKDASWAGKVFVSQGAGDKVNDITVVGCSDGKKFWAGKGKITSPTKCEFTIDLSAAGRSAEMTGVLNEDGLDFGSCLWSKGISKEDLQTPFQAVDTDPGGFYIDPDYYSKNSEKGSLMLSVQSGVVTIVMNRDGTQFVALSGTYNATTKEIKVDFTPVGGKADLSGVYSKGRIKWSDGTIFYNLETELLKLVEVVDADKNKIISKEEIMSAVQGGMLAKTGLEIFEKPLQDYKQNSQFRKFEANRSGYVDIDQFIDYVRGCVDLTKESVMMHKAPELQYFTPVSADLEPMLVKEVKLPAAVETHEILFEPISQYVFISQMAESVLVRVHLGNDGLLDDHQDAWYMGEIDHATGKGISGLHNLSLSYRYPGHIWVSLQFANTLCLVDAETMKTRMILQVPSMMTLTTGKAEAIGGPHCIRECPLTGDIWMALKGPVACNPILPASEIGHHVGGVAAQQAAFKRPCCSPDQLKKFMKQHSGKLKSFNTPLPEAYAVWRVNPREYDPDCGKEALGGYLYPVMGSPPMVAIDKHGHCWVAQDRNPFVACIDRNTHDVLQIRAPCPKRNCLSSATGPGIGAGPDGTIWCSLLGADAGLLKINPDTKKIVTYIFARSEWCRAFRLIHFDFDVVEQEDHNGVVKTRYFMYCLSSSLLDHQAMNAVMVLRFNSDWSMVEAKKVIPLPTQNCACHRISVTGRELPPDKRAVVVSELSTSQIVEIKTFGLRMQSHLVRHIEEPCANFPFERHIFYDDQNEKEKAEALEECDGTFSTVVSGATSILSSVWGATVGWSEELGEQEARHKESPSEGAAIIKEAPVIDGFYADMRRYKEGGFTGMVCVSATDGNKPSDCITFLGCDDGKTWWKGTGQFTNKDAGEFVLDMHDPSTDSKRKTNLLTCRFAQDTIKMPGGMLLARLKNVKSLEYECQMGDEPSGILNDPNHYTCQSFAGWRCISTRMGPEPTDQATLLICNDGKTFMTVHGTWDAKTKTLDMDFSPLDGPASLKATYKDGRVNWQNGHCFFNLECELKKFFKAMDSDGDQTLTKKEFIEYLGKPEFKEQFDIFSPATKSYIEAAGVLKEPQGVISDSICPAEFQAYMKAAFELTAPTSPPLKHELPDMLHFVPASRHREPVMLKEVRLPNGAETHEVFFEPVSRYVFVSQMAESVLVRIHVEDDGYLALHQDAWFLGVVDPTTGKGLSGLHNLSRSFLYPGFLWVSLQFANLLLLMDAETMIVKQVIKVPTLQTLKDGCQVSIGGPHCVRECPNTGDIWVALKGAVSCNPILEDNEINDHVGGKLARDEAKKHPCCSPNDLKKFMEKHHMHESEEFHAPHPDAYAIWRVHPQKYDPDAGEARGGKLFECQASPPMVAIDSSGNCWVAQDKSPNIAIIDAQTNVIKQISVPCPKINCLSTATGPGIVRAPDGAVWCALLGGDSAVLRCDPSSHHVTLYEFCRGLWAQALRIIHFDFDIVGFEGIDGIEEQRHFMYCLTSSLVDHEGINALEILRMDPTWTHAIARRTVPLPTQGSACHRIVVMGKDRPPSERVVVVSELTTARMLEVKTHNLRMNDNAMIEHISPPNDTCPHQRFIYLDPCEEHNVALLAKAKDMGGPIEALKKITG